MNQRWGSPVRGFSYLILFFFVAFWSPIIPKIDAASPSVQFGTANQAITGTTSKTVVPVVAVDGSNNMHVVYYDSIATNIMYTHNMGGTFLPPQAIATGVGNNSPPTISISGNKVNVAYDRSGASIHFIQGTINGTAVTWAAEIKIAQNSTMHLATVTSDDAGNVYIAWIDDRCGAGKYNVFYHIRNAAGGLSPEGSILKDCQYQTTPQLLVVNGKLHAAFLHVTDVYYARLESTGWATQNISNTPTNSYNPTITSDGTNIYIAWGEGIAGNNHDVFIRSSTNGGVTWGSSIPISNGPEFANFPTIDWSPSGGNVYIAWSEGPSPNDSDLHYREFKPSDGTFTAAVKITCLSGESIEPVIAVGTSQVGLVWQDRINANIPNVFFKGGQVGAGLNTTSCSAVAPTPAPASGQKIYGLGDSITAGFRDCTSPTTCALEPRTFLYLYAAATLPAGGEYLNYAAGKTTAFASGPAPPPGAGCFRNSYNFPAVTLPNDQTGIQSTGNMVCNNESGVIRAQNGEFDTITNGDIIITYGREDVNTPAISVDQFKTALTSIVTRAKAGANNKITLMTIPPMNQQGWVQYQPPAIRRQEFNDRIYNQDYPVELDSFFSGRIWEVAYDNQASIVPLHEYLLLTSSGGYFSPDNVNPGTNGHQVIATIMDAYKGQVFKKVIDTYPANTSLNMTATQRGYGAIVYYQSGAFHYSQPFTIDQGQPVNFQLRTANAAVYSTVNVTLASIGTPTPTPTRPPNILTIYPKDPDNDFEDPIGFDFLMYIIASAVYIMTIHFAISIGNEFKLNLMVSCFVLGGIIGYFAHSFELGFVVAVVLSLFLW